MWLQGPRQLYRQDRHREAEASSSWFSSSDCLIWVHSSLAADRRTDGTLACQAEATTYLSRALAPAHRPCPRGCSSSPPSVPAAPPALARSASLAAFDLAGSADPKAKAAGRAGQPSCP